VGALGPRRRGDSPEDRPRSGAPSSQFDVVGTSTQREMVTSATRTGKSAAYPTPARGTRISAMSIRISEGGRLFGILAGLGGAAMIGSAALPWALVHVRFGIPVHEYGVPRGIASADGRAMLVLGLFVMVGTVCFTALRSKWVRIGAGAMVVLAAAAGLVIAFGANPVSFAGRSLPAEVPCRDSVFPGPCSVDVTAGDGLMLARLGAILAVGAGIVALLRSGVEALPTPAAGHGARTDAGRTGPPKTPREPPTSGADLAGRTVVDVGTPTSGGCPMFLYSAGSSSPS
jgi:hypothetical protein